MEPSAELIARSDLARRLILDAGQLALGFFADIADLVIDTKLNGQDVVSAADREVEALIRGSIAAAFADDGFLGEETGLAPGRSGWRWTVDPIDGTSCFVHGLASWCISIALSDPGGATVFGVIHAPVSGDTYEATLGGGAFLNGGRIDADRRATLATGLVGLGASHRVAAASVAGFVERLLLGGGMFVRSGSAALSIADVAAGRLAAYYEPHINAWDCLAALLIVREAGGFVGDFPGEGRALLDGGPVVAAAPEVRADLLALIGTHHLPSHQGRSS